MPVRGCADQVARPIFFGVCTPASASTTQTAKTPLIWGEQRLYSPALSLISRSNPWRSPQARQSATFETK